MKNAHPLLPAKPVEQTTLTHFRSTQ